MAELKMLGKLPKELSKTEIENLAIDDANSVIDNEKYDLLKVLIELKRYNVYLNKLIDTIKAPALEKAQLIGDKKFNYADSTIYLTKRVVYDYSADEIWTDLNTNLTSIKEKLKVHQELLKNLNNESSEIVDESTGEVIKVTPPIKIEEETLVIRL